MKSFALVLLLSLAACGDRTSSPEGRSQIRDEKLQAQVDSIKAEEKSLLDSINMINQELKELRGKK